MHYLVKIENPDTFIMPAYLYLIIAFATAAIFSAVAMPWLLRICHRLRLYDLPNERKVHKSGIPRLGGIVFVPAVLVGMIGALALMSRFESSIPETIRFSTLLIGGGAVLVYFIGVIDDIAGSNARVKFLMQFCAAITFPACHLFIDSLYGFCGIYTLPLWVAYPLTVFVTLLIINAINLIDGIDGLAGCLSLIGLGTYCALFYGLNLITFVLFTASLGGAVCVFLCYNIWGRAERHTKTFMGDSGSLLLGVSLAYLTMKYAMADSKTLPERPDGLLIAYTTLLVPCFDLCRVALCRLRRHRGIFEPDRTHIHHKLMAAGLTMRQALVAIVALQLFFMALNIGLFRLGVGMEIIVAADVVIFTVLHILLPNGQEVLKNDGKHAE